MSQFQQLLLLQLQSGERLKWRLEFGEIKKNHKLTQHGQGCIQNPFKYLRWSYL